MIDTPTPTPEYLRASEAARMLGITSATLAKWARAGKVPVLRVGEHGHRHYLRSALMEFVTRNSGGPTSAA